MCQCRNDYCVRREITDDIFIFLLQKNRQTVEARSTATDKSEMDKDVISANYKKSNLPTSSTTINDISSDSDYMP